MKKNVIKTLEYLLKNAETEKEQFWNRENFPRHDGKLSGQIAAYKEAIRIVELEYRKTPDGIRQDISEAPSKSKGLKEK